MNKNNDENILKVLLKVEKNDLLTHSYRRIVIKYRKGLGKMYFIDNKNKIRPNCSMNNTFDWYKLEKLLKLLLNINEKNYNVNNKDDDSLINVRDIPSFEEVNEFYEPPIKRFKYDNAFLKSLDFLVDNTLKNTKRIRKVSLLIFCPMKHLYWFICLNNI